MGIYIKQNWPRVDQYRSWVMDTLNLQYTMLTILFMLKMLHNNFLKERKHKVY